ITWFADLSQDRRAPYWQKVECIPGPYDPPIGIEYQHFIAHDVDGAGTLHIGFEALVVRQNRGIAVGKPNGLMVEIDDRLFAEGGELGIRRRHAENMHDLAGKIDFTESVIGRGRISDHQKSTTRYGT